MRISRRKKHDGHNNELEDALRQLDRAKKEWPEVRRLRDAVRAVQPDLIADAMEQILRGAP